MKKSLIVLACVAIGLYLLTTDGFPRGGRSGWRWRWRGSRLAVAGLGPAASPSINRSPSMSRVAPSAGRAQSAARPAQQPAARTGGAAQRPTPGTLPARSGGGQAQLPAGGTRPSTLPAARSAGIAQRPTAGTLPARSGGGQARLPAGVSRPSTLPARGASQPGQRVSSDQLGSFLNLPANSGAGAKRRLDGASAGPVGHHRRQFRENSHRVWWRPGCRGWRGRQPNGAGRDDGRRGPRRRQGHRSRRQLLHQSRRRRGHPRPGRQYRGRRARRLVRQRPIRRRPVVDRRQRQLHPLGLLLAGLASRVSQCLVARPVGCGHGVGPGNLGHRRPLRRSAAATGPTTTTAKT